MSLNFKIQPEMDQPEVPSNMMVAGERVDEFSDPANNTGLPRPVGAELDDPFNSDLTSRDKTKMLQMEAILKMMGKHDGYR